MQPSSYFFYDAPIVQHFPNLSGGILLGAGLTNGPTSAAVRDLYLAEQRRVIEKIGSTPLSELETLAGWRAAFRLFGIDPTQYRSAAESLLRRLTKKGDIPCINTVVDLCNLVSIRYGLPVAAIDRRSLSGAIRVHFSTGEERFTPLGEAQSERPEVGEVVFSDEQGLVVARRWCWRQSEESAAREDTRDVLITIEAQHPGGRDLVAQALADLQPLLETNAGGDFESALVQ